MKKVIFMCAAIAMSNYIYAQTDSTKQLDEVVVTATKFPIKTSETGKVVTVITQEELQRNAGRSIGQILNQQTGLIVNGSTNTAGTNQDVYLRGAAAGKTLFLIDGVPLYDVSGISTAFDLNLLTTDQVEKIEILKGSQSTLYGSDAIAGVINIITKKGEDKPVGGSLQASAGSFNTYQGSAALYGKANKTNYRLQYSRKQSKGFSAANDQTGAGGFDKDGMEESMTRLFVEHLLTKKLTAKITGQYTKYIADVDAAAFADDKDFTVDNKNALAGLGITYTLGKSKIFANYNYNYTRRLYVDDSLQRGGGFSYYSKGNYQGRSHFAEVYSTINTVKNWTFVVGADYRYQLTDQSYFSVSSFGPFESTPIGRDTAGVNQLGVYTSVMWQSKSGFNLELGGRYNNFNKYGNVFTYSINPSYNLNKKVQIFANYSTGFSAPTLYQVYSEYRNPTQELQPEKSNNLEGGVAYRKDKSMLRAVYFSRNIEDNIVFYSSGAPNYESYYINADKQKVKGIELEAKTSIDKIDLNINYTNLDGKLETSKGGKDTAINNLYRRPAQTINLQVAYRFTPVFYSALNVQSVGTRQEARFAQAPLIMPAYAVWNLYSKYTVNKKASVFLDLRNIADAKYMEVRGYNSARFNVMGGFQLNL